MQRDSRSDVERREGCRVDRATSPRSSRAAAGVDRAGEGNDLTNSVTGLSLERLAATIRGQRLRRRDKVASRRMHWAGRDDGERENVVQSPRPRSPAFARGATRYTRAPSRCRACRSANSANFLPGPRQRQQPQEECRPVTLIKAREAHHVLFQAADSTTRAPQKRHLQSQEFMRARVLAGTKRYRMRPAGCQRGGPSAGNAEIRTMRSLDNRTCPRVKARAASLARHGTWIGEVTHAEFGAHELHERQTCGRKALSRAMVPNSFRVEVLRCRPFFLQSGPDRHVAVILASSVQSARRGRGGRLDQRRGFGFRRHERRGWHHQPPLAAATRGFDYRRPVRRVPPTASQRDRSS